MSDCVERVHICIIGHTICRDAIDRVHPVRRACRGSGVDAINRVPTKPGTIYATGAASGAGEGTSSSRSAFGRPGSVKARKMVATASQKVTR